MSLTLTFTGRSSILESTFNPPIHLTDGTWVLGLLSLDTFNSIPNVTNENNRFYYSIPGGRAGTFDIPMGTYSLDQLQDYIKAKLPSGSVFKLEGDNATQKVYMLSSVNVGFEQSDSLRQLLGFKRGLYLAEEVHVSEHPTSINPLNVFRVHCNLVVDSYVNGEPSHVIHEFYPNVPPGFKIVEVPAEVIYLPINGLQIDNMVLKLVNEEDKLLDLRDEYVTVRLHLKKV